MPDGQDRRYYAVTVRPTVFANRVPDHVILNRVFPPAGHRIGVFHDWLPGRLGEQPA